MADIVCPVCQGTRSADAAHVCSSARSPFNQFGDALVLVSEILAEQRKAWESAIQANNLPDVDRHYTRLGMVQEIADRLLKLGGA